MSVLEATDKKYHKNTVWRCLCKCGNEVEVAASLLTSGNTTSCGCLNAEILQYANRYMEGTSLRQFLDNRVIDNNSISGFIGVQPKRNKWAAYINYKGRRYYLGVYTNIEDAVAVRKQAEKYLENGDMEIWRV